MQARWLRLTVRDSRTPTTRTQKLSRRLLRNDRGPCRPSRRAAVTSLFIRTPIRSQTNQKFYAPASLLPENVVYRGTDQLIAFRASQPRWGKIAASPSSPAIQRATLGPVHRPPSDGGVASRSGNRARSSGRSTLGALPLRRRKSPRASGPCAL